MTLGKQGFTLLEAVVFIPLEHKLNPPPKAAHTHTHTHSYSRTKSQGLKLRSYQLIIKNTERP